MTGQMKRRMIGHVVLLVAGVGLASVLAKTVRSVMHPVVFFATVYACAEAGWAGLALVNQRGYDRNPRRPVINEIHALVGCEAVVSKACNPRGLVRIDGELWQAEARGSAEVRAGDIVVITRADGLVLEVARRGAAGGDAGEGAA